MKKLILTKLQKILWNHNNWALVGFIQRPNFCKIYKDIAIKDKATALEVSELFNIYSSVITTKKIKGDIAEVGVFKGGSAKAMAIARAITKQDKIIHLFDTYEGLPEVLSIDSKWNGKMFKKGQFEASLEQVQSYLKKFKNIKFYKGLFPKTSDPVKNKKFSLVHLDVDIYSSTIDSLKFFYPRMNRGGIIISHDYPFAKGVQKASDEFFKEKPEVIVSLINKQALVVKM